MFELYDNEFIRFFAALNGPVITSTMLMGECGELISAVADSFRDDTNSMNNKLRSNSNIIEEINDVLVTINTYCMAHGITKNELSKDFHSRLMPRYKRAKSHFPNP